ncbi:hypothetical protein AVEN_23725-1 [Araneus ventricosus]|uniref:SCAN box domain-containing protein n=1 Tax=Araneus ventricosus TaxID=182803 RepID=A0A4Y2S6W8_ARAVE|nr:hypothetical protein AVEN_23725-1 [Araneus ventricosus]
MAYLAKGRREDMFVLAKELDLEPSLSMTIKKLKDLITNDSNYDEEFTKNIYAVIVEQRKAKEELEEKQRLETLAEAQRKAELEEKRRLETLAETRRKEELEEKQRQEALAELRRKDEVELERLKIEAQLKLGTTTTEADYSKLRSKEVSKFLHRFEVKQDVSLYLILFERQVHRLSIPKEHWVSYLLGLLPPEISHIIAREPNEKADDYDHVKELLLKRFKLTPEKLAVFYHQKTYNRIWTDYYHEFATYFDGWILGLKIETYEDLQKLIISDHMKQRAPTDFKEYFLDEWTSINSPDELAEKFEEYEDIKKTLKQNASGAYFKNKQDFKGAEKYPKFESPRKFQHNRTDKKFSTSTSYNRHHGNPQIAILV